MPHLIMKRSDIPDGTLQILDLKPNTSQRKFPYQKVGQTKYIDAVDRDTPRLVTAAGIISFLSDTTSIEAWILTNMNDGTGAPATGSITTDVQANFSDAETVTISDGVTSVTFEFDVTGTNTPGAGNVEVDISGDTTAADVSATLWAAIDGSALDITAVDGGGTITLTNNTDGTIGNVAIADTVGAAAWATSGMAAGVDAGPLTAAQAETNADDILGLLGFGTTTAAGALTLAAINGALTTGSITAEQLPAVLSILAGQPYTVPAGTVISDTGVWGVSPAIGAEGGPEYGPERATYETGALRISFGVGALSKMVSADFDFLDTQAQAVVVYNDDGSLFV